jgi:HAD superfamily hydrolase (TIGR01509 family)
MFSPRALVMDLDGTLADTLPLLFEAFRHAVAPFVDRPPTDEEVYATFGPVERECLAKVLPPGGAGGRPFSEILDQADERFHRYYEEHHDRVRPFPGIPEVVGQAAAAGWQFGVFTGKGRRTAEFTLRELGFWDLVRCLVSGDDVTRPKPDPEGVRLALARLGVAPEDFLLVGDSPADVEAGRGAGVRTAGALWGAFDPAATRRAGPTWALASPYDLAPLLRR